MNNMFPIIYYKNIYDDLRMVPLVYKDIIPEMYLISPHGYVYSLFKNRIMKTYINHGGYERVCLITYNGKRNFSIHRLVASTFIINIYPTEYTDVNHINGDKLKNSYLNLEWCTNAQNKHHASVEGLYQHGENRYNSVYPDSFIREICIKLESGMDYNSVYKYYTELYPNSSNTIGSLIYKIYNRKTRNNIVSQYTF